MTNGSAIWTFVPYVTNFQGSMNVAVLLLACLWKLCCRGTPSELWLLVGFWVLELQQSNALTHKGCGQRLLSNLSTALVLCCAACWCRWSRAPATCDGWLGLLQVRWVAVVSPSCGVHCPGGIFYASFGILTNESKKEGCRMKSPCHIWNSRTPVKDWIIKKNAD